MRQINRFFGLLLAVSLVGACSQEIDRSFCSSHASEHWQHREQHPQLQIEYASSGELQVQLSLPEERAILLETATPGDILAMPPQCVAQPLQRSSQQGLASLRFEAACGDQLPASLGVPLLLEYPGIEEVEVSMRTPAVRKHFIVHHQCERALFNIAEGTASE